jgi:quinol-cytochrome oxidoreductase complex cytochrome b subunit
VNEPTGPTAPASAARTGDTAAARRLTSLWGVSFGDAALAAFVLCVVSGVLLLPAFDARDGVRSIGQWLLVNPGAVVLRNLHYWTAQAFLVLTVLHAWDHLRRGREQRLPRGVWLRLVASVPVLAFLMLSGFLLRGDADAQQAQRILEEMLDLLPLVGPLLAQFLLGSDGGSTQVVFLQHAATATVIVWLVVVEHARRLWGGLRAWVLITAGCGALALLVSPGLHDGQHAAVKGPWYFLGLQELLHWSSWPAWLLMAGAAALLLLAWLPEARPSVTARAKGGLYAVVGLYLVLCMGVLFARGANWSLAPAWPAGPGDLRAGPALERVTVDTAKVACPW